MRIVPVKYYALILSLVAFLLPLHQRFVPPAIIALTGLSFLCHNEYRSLVKNKISIALITLYVLYLIGMIYTENINSGKFDLEVKLSILIFPIALLPILLLNREQLLKCFVFFIWGCIVASILCLLIAAKEYRWEQMRLATNQYTLNNGINLFLGSRFSFFLHPSYFSMYISFGLSIMMFGNIPGFMNRFYIKWPIIVLFIIMIVLLASKAGIFVLFALVLIYIIKMRSIKLTILLLGVFISSFIVLYNFAPEFALRFIGFASVISENKVESSSTESSTARVLVWDSSLKIIKENVVFGCGTGDVKTELNKVYKEKNYLGLLQKELNAHNQFLQTMLAIGLIGLLILIYIFIATIRVFVKHRSVLGILLVFILLSNFAVESMLETQAGVVFFAFWLSIMNYNVRILQNRI